MRPTEVLLAEHDAIKVMLQVVDRISRRLESGDRVADGDLVNVVCFMQGLADACHHMEEGVLFLAIEEAGVPRQGGPIGVMLLNTI